MTALLAFFIVLNSLAKEQTGANLYTGTGSFVTSLRSAGLPGKHGGKSSEQPFQKEEAGPLYIVNDGEAKEDAKPGTGPDKEKNALRVIDRERDQLRRFLIEIGEFSKVNALPKSNGKVVFDFFEKIEKTSPLVSENATEVFRQAMTRATSANYRIDVIVWANNPGITAWKKATVLAKDVKEDLVDRLGVPSRLKAVVTATGKPWFFSDEKRPRFSISVQKLGGR